MAKCFKHYAVLVHPINDVHLAAPPKKVGWRSEDLRPDRKEHAFFKMSLTPVVGRFYCIARASPKTAKKGAGSLFLRSACPCPWQLQLRKVFFLRTGRAPPVEARQHPPAESNTKALCSASSTAP